jgi:hypothetical protein
MGCRAIECADSRFEQEERGLGQAQPYNRRVDVSSRCHPERSEGSVSVGVEMLRCAQHDSPIMLPLFPHAVTLSAAKGLS